MQLNDQSLELWHISQGVNSLELACQLARLGSCGCWGFVLVLRCCWGLFQFRVAGVFNIVL